MFYNVIGKKFTKSRFSTETARIDNIKRDVNYYVTLGIVLHVFLSVVQLFCANTFTEVYT